VQGRAAAVRVDRGQVRRVRADRAGRRVSQPGDASVLK
jgi:hypothetical protein